MRTLHAIGQASRSINEGLEHFQNVHCALIQTRSIHYSTFSVQVLDSHQMHTTVLCWRTRLETKAQTLCFQQTVILSCVRPCSVRWWMTYLSNLSSPGTQGMLASCSSNMLKLPKRWLSPGRCLLDWWCRYLLLCVILRDHLEQVISDILWKFILLYAGLNNLQI